MDDQKLQEARWRESLELLGLTDSVPAPAAHEPAPARAPQPVVIPPAPVREELPMERTTDPIDEIPDPMPDAVDEIISDTEVGTEALDDSPDEPETGAESDGNAEVTAPLPGEDDKPRRGRRRRRRGRRRGGADKPEGEEAAKPEAAEREPEAPRPRPPQERGRDRGPRDRGPTVDKRRDRPEVLAAKVQPEERWEEEAPSAEIEDDAPPETPVRTEEVDTLADWDVPSWQDLISSLYRPDR